MPTITLLGIRVWIPDFTDLVNAVTAPLRESVTSILSGIQDRVWPLLQNLQGQISLFVRPLIDQVIGNIGGLSTFVSSSFQGISSTITNQVQNLFAQGSFFMSTLSSTIANVIQSSINQLFLGLQPIAQNIATIVRPWIDSITAYLKGDIAPLASQILKTSGTSLTMISTMFPEFRVSNDALRRQIEKLQSQIQGNPIEFEKIFAAKVNEIFNPLAGLAGDIWKSANDFLKPIIETVSRAIQAALAAIIQPIISVFYSLEKAGGELWPQGSLNRSLGGMVSGMVAFNAAYVTITGLELLHPLKQVGLLRIIDATRALLGADVLGRLIGSTIFASLYTTPLRYEMQAMLRPAIPDPRRADTMLFQNQINEDQWHQLYSFHGFKEQHITAWHNSMWLEPSDRMIVGLVEGGQVPLDQLQRILRRRGYNAETQAMIMLYATKKALSDEIAASRSEINSSITDGIIDIMQAETELRELGDFGDQLEFRLNAMRRRMERVDIKDQIEILTTQVKSYEITVEQYQNELIALDLRMTRVSKLVAKEEARRKPKVTTPAATKRDLAAATFQKFYIEGALATEDQLRRYLTELTPAYATDRIDLLVLDANIRKAKTVAAA
jgi:hypothetical protein